MTCAMCPAEADRSVTTASGCICFCRDCCCAWWAMTLGAPILDLYEGAD